MEVSSLNIKGRMPNILYGACWRELASAFSATSSPMMTTSEIIVYSIDVSAPTIWIMLAAIMQILRRYHYFSRFQKDSFELKRWNAILTRHWGMCLSRRQLLVYWRHGWLKYLRHGEARVSEINAASGGTIAIWAWRNRLASPLHDTGK